MGKLMRGPNWFVEVRGNEHFPCHFHVIGSDFQAQVDVETLRTIVGTMPRAVAKAVVDWAEKNRTTVVTEWNRLNPDLSYTLKTKENPDE